MILLYNNNFEHVFIYPVSSGNIEKLLFSMVPSGRIELPRPYEQQILSLSRLPIPPQGHINTN